MNIVFEGLPGAGKTTLISALMKDKNGIILGEFCDGVEGRLGDIEYFVNNEKKKDEIMRSNPGNRVCCVDRLWQSTLVANAVICGVTEKKELKDLYKIIYKGYEFENYVYVFLDMPSEISLARNVNSEEVRKCMWFDELFNKKAYGMYHLLYENLEYVIDKEVSKIRIDTRENSMADEVEKLNEWLF